MVLMKEIIKRAPDELYILTLIIILTLIVRPTLLLRMLKILNLTVLRTEASGQ